MKEEKCCINILLRITKYKTNCNQVVRDCCMRITEGPYLYEVSVSPEKTMAIVIIFI